MLARLRPHLTFANVASALALFVALSTGGAYATHLVVDSSDVVDNSLTGADVRGKPGTGTTPAMNGSLTTDDVAGQQANAANGTTFVDGTLTQWDIKNGSLTGGDLAGNTVGGGKITDSSLKGTDIDEASLGQVPSALLGGMGRWSALGSCDPESSTFVTCGVVTLDLPAQSRVLVTAAMRALTDSTATGSEASGACRVATSLGSLPSSVVGVTVVQGATSVIADDPFAVTAITDPLGGGSVDFGVECNDALSTGPDGIHFSGVQVSAVALSPN
jgi:hypothetical protein